ncbi:MAG: cysteine hydrolase family protein [Pseudomonadota bacterium]
MHSALLIIDIQNDYFPGGKMELEGAERAAAEAATLLSCFRQNGAEVIHIQHVATKAGASFFLPDSDGVAIHAAVLPAKNETVMVKHFPNSFRDTGLHEHLQRLGVSRLVVAGMMTHMCVDTTVRAAADLGYAVTLAQEACATRALSFCGVAVAASEVQAAYLAALDGSFASVKSVREIAAAQPGP